MNRGCSLAYNDGYTVCMTMDQDSSWMEKQIKEYLSLIEQNDDKSIVSFAPNLNLPDVISVLGKIKRIIVKKKVLRKYGEEIFPKKVITSGNIIFLDVWKKIGGFYEPFFIDEVDHEFCFRLLENGYRITLYNHIYMNQIIGAPRKTFFPKESHNALRLYYMVRNRLYMKDMYPDICFEEDYKKNIRSLYRSIFFTFSLKKYKFAIKGYFDYKKNKTGKME